jgi:general secretion pathway protein E
VQSALTGHLVLSTLHTNDAPSSVMRLLDMGVPDYLLTSSLNAVQAQRLVRNLCESCKEPYVATPELIERSGLGRLTQSPEVTLYRPVGCDACGNTGYAGRSAILEILHVSDAVRSIIVGSRDLTAIRRCAFDDGMQSMRDDGLLKALSGTTTIEEVVRVTPEHVE